MGWARTFLLGDIGNRLDIADAEEGIAPLQRAHGRAERELASRERDITVLKQELGRQKLAIQALTRFLIEKGVVATAELDDFIAQIDAEDGVADGRMELDSHTGRLRFPEKKVLRSIRAYTLETWGSDQEQRYLDRIWSRFEDLRQNPERYRHRPDFFPDAASRPKANTSSSSAPTTDNSKSPASSMQPWTSNATCLPIAGRSSPFPGSDHRPLFTRQSSHGQPTLPAK